MNYLASLMWKLFGFGSVLAVCLLVQFGLYAQSYNYTRYSVEDGLAGITVYSIAQDKDGFLWIATATGLSRFDGRTFKNYTVSDGLPDNDIIKVFVDSKNRVWVLPFLNKICFIENGVIHSQENDSLLKKVNLESIPYSINEDQAGNLCILEENRIVVIEKQAVFTYDQVNNGPFITLQAGKNALMEMNFAIIQESFGLNKIIAHTIIRNHTLKIISLDTVKDPFTRNYFITNHSYSCIAAHHKIRVVNQKTAFQFIYKLPPNLNTLSFLNDSLFAVNCADTVFIMSTQKMEIKAKFVTGKNVNTCFLDSEGNYWFGTIAGGLLCVYSLNFYNYEKDEMHTDLMVSALTKYDNQILVGTHNGRLLNLSFASNAVKKFTHLGYVLNFRINAMLNTGNSLLIASDGIYEYKNGRSTYYSYASIKIIHLYGDTLLIGSNINLTKTMLKNKLELDILWEGRTSAAGYYFNKYYIGTLEGLYVKDASNNITDCSKINKKLGSKIYDFALDETGILWVATYGRGLVGLNRDSVVYAIDEGQGLSSNMCRQVVAKDGYLWVATDKGINRISRSAGGYNIQVFGSRHGLVSDIVNCLYVDSNTVYAGTPLGVSVFKPDEISNSSICNIRVTQINSIKQQILFPQAPVLLAAGDNSLRISYSGISFKSRENMKYYYRMSSINKTWQTTTQTTIEYGKLHPGNYLFEIYAENAFGKRSAVQQISISIDNFFYQRWWFYALAGLLILALLGYIAYKIVLNEKRKSAEKQILLMQMGELEQMALKAQMNPHFIFNCLNSIQQFIFLKNPREVNYFITRFATLIRQTLEVSGQKLVLLSSEIKYYEIYLQLEKFRFEENLAYQISVSPEINKEEIMVPPLLLQPFVENSIKHGIRHEGEKTGKIKLHFSIAGQYLLCEVMDNGIGRKASALLKIKQPNKHQSRGIALVEKRIANINAFAKNKIEMEIEDLVSGDRSLGTKVMIKIPLINE